MKKKNIYKIPGMIDSGKQVDKILFFYSELKETGRSRKIFNDLKKLIKKKD